MFLRSTPRAVRVETRTGRVRERIGNALVAEGVDGGPQGRQVGPVLECHQASERIRMHRCVVRTVVEVVVRDLRPSRLRFIHVGAAGAPLSPGIAIVQRRLDALRFRFELGVGKVENRKAVLTQGL